MKKNIDSTPKEFIDPHVAAFYAKVGELCALVNAQAELVKGAIATGQELQAILADKTLNKAASIEGTLPNAIITKGRASIKEALDAADVLDAAFDQRMREP